MTLLLALTLCPWSGSFWWGQDKDGNTTWLSSVVMDYLYVFYRKALADKAARSAYKYIACCVYVTQGLLAMILTLELCSRSTPSMKFVILRRRRGHCYVFVRKCYSCSCPASATEVFWHSGALQIGLLLLLLLLLLLILLPNKVIHGYSHILLF